MLRSGLFDYSDAYIVIKEAMDLLDAATNEKYKVGKNVASKNNAPFMLLISKTNKRLIEIQKILI